MPRVTMSCVPRVSQGEGSLHYCHIKEESTDWRDLERVGKFSCPNKLIIGSYEKLTEKATFYLLTTFLESIILKE